MKALIVDDSSAMRAFLRRILAKHGFETSQAGDGEAALAALKVGENPDLVLLDWNMPLRDGLQTLLEIRSCRAYDAIRVMMVTTEIESDRITQALEAGANEFVMKPFTPEVMSDKLTMLGFPATQP